MKKIVTSAIIGASMLFSGASAHAALYEINLYGASAQFKYWTASTPVWFSQAAASGGLGCATANIYQAQDLNAAGKADHGIAVCMGDTAFGGLAAQTSGGATVNGSSNNTVVFRYSSKASYDGIDAVQGLDRKATVDCAGQPGQRKMADVSGITWTAYGTAVPFGGVTTTACQDVTLGASDVAAITFNQTTGGAQKGHKGGECWKAVGSTCANGSGGIGKKSVTGYTVGTGYTVKKPLIVPFGFYANPNVVALGIDNMSRLMATQIFSDSVNSWAQLDASLGTPSQTTYPIVVCMRHAGSGTLATLNAAVLRGNVNMVGNERIASTSSKPVVWFNETSDDMKVCIQENGGVTGGYAVGYMDADTSSSAGKYTKMKWMGVDGSDTTTGKTLRDKVKNGQWDFWSHNNVIYSSSEPNDVKWLIDNASNGLVTFAGKAANLNLISSVKNFWAASEEMKVDKNNDFAWPTRSKY